MEFRASFYDGDNSTDMWNMLAYAQRNFPDFPHNLSEVFAFDNNYVVPDSGHLVVYPAVVFLSLALVVVGCRLWRRYITRGRRLGVDDWLMLAATIAAIAYTAIEILLVKHGCIGKHCYDCKFSSMIYGYRYISLIVYLVAVVLTKLSILAFIRQLSSKTDVKLRRVIIATAVFIIGSALAVGLMVTFDCRPIPAAWDYLIRTRTEHGCFSMQEILVTWSVVLAVTDLWLLVLPSQLIWRLNLPKRNKMSLTFMFSFGLAATAASFVKARFAVKSYDTWDLTWHFVPILITSHLEITLGLIAASLPALNSWVSKALSRYRSSWPAWASVNSRLIPSRLQRKGGKSADYSTGLSNTITTSTQNKKTKVTVVSTVESVHMPADKMHGHEQITTECCAAEPGFSWVLPQPPLYDDVPKKVAHSAKLSVSSQTSFDLIIQNPAGELGDHF